jgi:CBS domain-containing protein
MVTLKPLEGGLKYIIMDIKEIVNRINENSRLLADGSISEIERDILLEDLRSLYLLAKGSVPVRHVVIEQPKATVIDTIPIIAIKEEVLVPPVIEQKPVEIMIPKEEPKQVVMTKEPEPVRIAEVIMQEQTKVKPASLNEIFAGEEKSLNERLSGGDKRSALNDHAGRKDLKSMIDFNKQYVLTNELFKGDSQAFQTAISRINDAQTIEVAFEYIKTDLLPKYQWNGEMQSARLFDKLVRQKFGV